MPPIFIFLWCFSSVIWQLPIPSERLCLIRPPHLNFRSPATTAGCYSSSELQLRYSWWVLCCMVWVSTGNTQRCSNSLHRPGCWGPTWSSAHRNLWVSLHYMRVFISLLAWRKVISKVPAGQNFRLNMPQKALRNQQLSQKQGISLCCEWKTPQIIQLSEGTDASNRKALSLLQWHDIHFLKFQYSKRYVWKACCCLTCSRNILSDIRTYCSIQCKKA